MENLFIQKIFAITESILRGDCEFAPTLETLKAYLARAQKTRMLRYEAEILNTIALLYQGVGDIAQVIVYFSLGLEKAQQTDDISLRIKLLSNLAEMYMINWDIETAHQYIDQGIELGKQDKDNAIGMIYLHSNKIACLVRQGNFAEAQSMLVDAWHIAQNPDLLNYSRYEYFQVIFQLRYLNALVEMAVGDCDAARENVAQAVHLANDSKNKDHHIAAHLGRFYQALICDQDETSAKQWEQSANEVAGGRLSCNSLLEMALFMFHTQQLDRAAQYAGQVLEEAASNPHLPSILTTYAQQILQGVR